MLGGTFSFSVLAVGFVVQIFSVLLSSPYTPHDFAKTRARSNEASNHHDLSPLKIRRVLFLTAHPDDEAMFFGPTIVGMNASLISTPGKLDPVHETASSYSPKIAIPQSLVRKDSYEVYSLCLSSGGTPGSKLAERRKEELARSLDVLGVPLERRRVLDEPFVDNITLPWDAELVASHVKPFVDLHNIQMIFTFDTNGVSAHPNHISLAHGATRLLQDLAEKHHPSPPPLRLFTLRSIGLPNKYSGAFGGLLTRAHISSCILHRLGAPPEWTLATRIGNALGCETREHATFVSNFRGYFVVLTAMLKHQSQMEWFRWLYLGWSRYLWVNDWVEVKV